MDLTRRLWNLAPQSYWNKEHAMWDRCEEDELTEKAELDQHILEEYLEDMGMTEENHDGWFTGENEVTKYDRLHFVEKGCIDSKMRICRTIIFVG